MPIGELRPQPGDLRGALDFNDHAAYLDCGGRYSDLMLPPRGLNPRQNLVRELGTCDVMNLNNAITLSALTSAANVLYR